MISFMFGATVTVAIVAVVIAFKKHKTFKGVEASVLKEVDYLKQLEQSAKGTVKADYQASIDYIERLFK